MPMTDMPVCVFWGPLLILFLGSWIHPLVWPPHPPQILDITNLVASTLPLYLLLYVLSWKHWGMGSQEEESVNPVKFHLTASLRCIMKSTCNFWCDLLKLNCSYNSLAICLLSEEDLCYCFLANQLTGRQIFNQVGVVLVLMEEVFWNSTHNDRYLIY